MLYRNDLPKYLNRQSVVDIFADKDSNAFKSF